jgi:L-alanine-DL-glutamate epimerase-like enolase superfamily enzyme
VENTIVNYLAPLLLGMEPEDISGIHVRMNAAIAPGLSIGMPLAKAAVDIACYDLWGKQEGLPVWALLGGAGMTANALGWTVNSMDLKVVNAQLVEGRDRGYCNFNFKVGPPQDVAYDIQ